MAGAKEGTVALTLPQPPPSPKGLGEGGDAERSAVPASWTEAGIGEGYSFILHFLRLYRRKGEIGAEERREQENNDSNAQIERRDGDG